MGPLSPTADISEEMVEYRIEQAREALFMKRTAALATEASPEIALNQNLFRNVIRIRERQ